MRKQRTLPRRYVNLSSCEKAKDFAKEVRKLMIALEEDMKSYDVSTLFTSIPVDKVLMVMKDRLVKYNTLKNRTPVSREDHKIMELCLIFCFKTNTTYKFIMRPLVLRCHRSFATCIYRILSYIDDTHTVLVKTHALDFPDHLNSRDDDIKWTTEGEVTTRNEEVNIGTRTERALAFLDTWSVINEDVPIKTKVYRKQTHMDQYLNFNSNHPYLYNNSVYLIGPYCCIVIIMKTRYENLRNLQDTLFCFQANGA